MDTRTLEITRPCPVELDVDRSGRQFFCDHCQKDVHVLANWPRAEAEAFIAANRGNSVCVSLRRDARGELVYADSPVTPPPAALVPASRLRRRWLPEAAAAGVAAALTACAPHGPPRELAQADAEDVHVRAPAVEVTVPDEEALSQREGGLVIEEAEDPPPPVERGEIRAKKQPPRVERGTLRAVKPQRPQAPKQAPKAVKKWDMIDGGIDF